jgi:uncharacterized iron-regulated protein
MRFLVALLVLLLLAPAAPAAEAPPLPESWASPLLREHPLAGRIWQPAGGTFATPREVAGRLAEADVVLLGEKHDNPDHHRLQAWAIAAMAAAGRRPAVAFEMIPRDKAEALAGYLEAGGDAAGLGPALAWSETGWPDWALYRPIAEAALSAGLPLAASDLPEAKRGQISEQGIAALPDGLVARWALDRPWTAEMRDGLLQELSEAHCRVAPPAAFAGLAEVQRARDAAMADALLAAHEDDTKERPGERPGERTGEGAVLIAGKGHTRPDRGVPWYLRQRAPELSALSVAFVEVEAGRADAATYGEFGGHDLIWFTPRLDDEDPCAKFAEQLERMRPAE